MSIKPERKIEIILWDWLMAKSKPNNIVNIYFNSKNELGWKTFSVKGIQKKPDLLIKIFDGYRKSFFAIEVKDNSQSKNILMGSKIIDLYYQNYINKKTEYIINNNIVPIEGFLIASQGSKKGFLFNEEEVTDNWSTQTSSSKYQASKKYKIIPRYERKRTFEFIRFIWEIYGKIRNNFEEKPSIGILIANTEDNNKPYMMITHFNKNKRRWSQRWWSL